MLQVRPVPFFVRVDEHGVPSSVRTQVLENVDRVAEAYLDHLRATGPIDEFAREFIDRAGRAEMVEVRLGNAVDILQDLGPDGGWDAMFVDADKERYGTYLKHAQRLLRPGGLLLADNVFWQGRILDDSAEADTATRALQDFNRALAGHDQFDATILPVGDGVAVAVRR